ncbi:hypothetical protein EJ05DRAFT_1203 [Pseudovirgaria hyperparasitica]|uniref:Uncharacterized protein n=1 Tax=Pseudovirgaria hyperparasitica TaxID=470096 RepID=A0A6A6WHY9_9PEZI|nr:uncharacterized protein EJ05DRAFT_1203 [Pseudovirgaria hyperparasitica]KAF2762423.1 hypothetical protein EJ05DRAFT_1203 [Pseudovirgaria hyperparasitica]
MANWRKRASLKRASDLQKRRKHTIVPWLESPLVGADVEELVFAQRHEANTIELFFDLFFAANLATFTAYHSVTDAKGVWPYIGFFAILWATWFQITLHDVRFARDSVYERACKTVQMVCFVGFALVGSKFSPSRDAKSNTNFRILCYTLVVSRALLVLQYLVVLACTYARKGYSKLYLPLALNTLVYLVAAAIFGAMTPAFAESAQTHRGIYALWWAVMAAEGALTIAISSRWRMLSFKKTHLVERMGLLTLIVIGEGAIGVTKTIASMMGKYGLEPDGSGQTLCYILVLVLVWMLYFDTHPHRHFGTIRQQIWSTLHFVHHLCIVGVVEGSRQMALAHHTLLNTEKVDKLLWDACGVANLDGEELVSYLVTGLEYFQFDTKVESDRYISLINNDLWAIGNSTGICDPLNLAEVTAPPYPVEFWQLAYDTIGALYASLGMKLPLDQTGFDLALSSWRAVYIYFWTALLFLLFKSLIFLVLIRRNKIDMFDYASIGIRAVGMMVCVGFLGALAKDDVLINLIKTPAILPSVVALLLIILLCDHFARVAANWRLKKSGQPFDEDKDEGHHGHGEQREHVENHGHDGKEVVRPSVMPLQGTDASYSSSYTGYNPMPAMHMNSDSSLYSGLPTPYSSPVQGHVAVQYVPVAQLGH